MKVNDSESSSSEFVVLSRFNRRFYRPSLKLTTVPSSVSSKKSKNFDSKFDDGVYGVSKSQRAGDVNEE